MRNKFRPGKFTLVITLSLTCFAGLSRADVFTFLGSASAGGYNFLNFNFPQSGTNAATGTNSNGISNNGAVAGFSMTNFGSFLNYTGVPPFGTATFLDISASPNAMAFGINSNGEIVGTDGLGNAFFRASGGAVSTFIPNMGTAATALGINDKGNIVGQYTTAGGTTPGFYLSTHSGGTFDQINAPFGPNSVFAQGINNNGLIVGFFLGTDGNDHGFDVNIANASMGELTGTFISDPTIKPVEPGATFMFSQILGINDQGIAVGYYGDSTLSQHGFFYNTKTGKYTFLDDPSEAFHNGVEVTQITGINNSGEITGFYSDANGVFHGFVADPVPEPTFLPLAGFGLAAIWLLKKNRR